MRSVVGNVAVILLVATVPAGCSGSRPASRPRSYSSAYRLSTPLPALPASNVAAELRAETMLADLARGTCPPTLDAQGPGAFPDSSPAFQASSLIICRYDGVKAPHPLRLLHSAKVTNPATASSWWQRFHALPVVDRSAFHCPADDDGSAVLAGFLGAEGRAVVVQVSLQGCRYATIGQDTYRASGSTLREDLLRLVP